MFLFSWPSPLSTSSNNIILGKETLINIDNSKKPTKSSKLCNSKKIRML